MDITGKIIAVLPTKSGISATSGNEWSLQTAVLETQDQYPKKLAFDVFGADRITQFNLQVGDIATVFFDFDAHEYNGRWFNSVRAFNVEKSGQQVQQTQQVQQPTPQPPANTRPQGVAQTPQQAPQQQQLFNGGTPNTDIDQLPF